jgi:hypothetical protein
MNVETAATLLMNVLAGVQPTFAAVTRPWIAGVGVAKSTKVSAPDALSARTCEVTFPADRSNGCALTIWLFFAPRPTRRPAKEFLPKASFWYSTPIFAVGRFLTMYLP